MKPSARVLILLLVLSTQAASVHARTECARHDCACCRGPEGANTHACSACSDAAQPEARQCTCKPDGRGEERQVPVSQKPAPEYGAPEPWNDEAKPSHRTADTDETTSRPRPEALVGASLARAPPPVPSPRAYVTGVHTVGSV